MRQRMKPWLAGLMLVLAIGLVPGLAIAEGDADGAAAPDADVAAAVADQAANAAADAPDATPAEDPADVDKAQAQEPEGGKQEPATADPQAPPVVLGAQSDDEDEYSMPWDDWDYQGDLGLGTPVLAADGADVYYTVKPTESGLYRFTSRVDDEWDADPYIEILENAGDEDWYWIGSGYGSDFKLTRSLEADHEYIVHVSYSEGVTYIECDSMPAPAALSVSVRDGASLVYGVDNLDGDWDYYWDDEESSEISCFYFYQNRVAALLDVVAINADGTEEVLSREDYTLEYNSYEWSVGGDNAAIVTYGDLSETVNIPVVESPVKEISFHPAASYELVEGIDGEYDVDDDGNEYFRYYTPGFHEDDQLIVTGVDGKTIYTAEYDEDGFLFFNTENDSIDSDLIERWIDQHDQHWSVGEEHYLTVGYMGAECQVPVAIVANSVKGIEFIPVTPYELIEYVDGEYDEDDEGDEYFWYGTPDFREGDRLIVEGADGKTTYTAEYDEDDDLIFRSGDAWIDSYDIDSYSGQSSNHWTLGNENYLTIEYMGVKCRVPVTIVENPVKGIEFIPAKPYELVEYVDGEYEEDEEGDEYFWYETPRFREGDRLIVEGADGKTTYTAEYDEYDDLIFRSGDARIDADEIDRYSAQSSNHWILGNENYFTIEYMGAKCRVPVTVAENTVRGIELIPAASYECMEGVDGYYCEDEDGNEYFRYYIPDFCEGDRLVVVGVDGETTYTAEWDGDEEGLVFRAGPDTIHTDSIEWYSYQDEEHWTLGGDNHFVIEYMGAICRVPVTIVANPVKGISFTPKDDIVYYRGLGGSYEWDSIDEEYFYYDYPDFREGDVLTVEYADRGSVDYTYSANRDSTLDSGFYDAEGNMLPEWPDWRSNQYNRHWVEAGSYQWTLEYLGVKCEVPVELKENPVEEILFQSKDGFKVVENKDGYLWEGDDESEMESFFRYYEPSFQAGDKLTVKYTDGSTIVYTYDDGEFTAAGHDAIIADDVYTYSDQWENHWTKGSDNVMFIRYIGHDYEVPVEVIADSGEDADEDVEAAVALITKAIDNPTEENIQAAQGAIDGLDESQKEALPEGILNQFNEVTRAVAADKAAAAEVEKLIAAAKDDPTEATVKAAQEALGNLSEAARAYLPEGSETELDAAAKKVEDDLNAAKAEAEAQAAADEAAKLIEAAVMDPTEKNVNAAQEAVSGLSGAAKEKLGTAALDQLKAATKQMEENKAAQGAGDKAEPVAQAITAKNVSKTYGDKAFDLGATAKTALSYASDNEKVATVDAQGKVTITGAGSAKITITAAASDEYKAATQTVTVTVAKAANPMKVKAKAVKAKAKKKTTVKAAKAFAVSNAKGKLIYKVVKADKKAKKKIVISKAGKVTVKKGLKKGTTYKVKVKITAAGDANYNSASKTVTLKVKVK